MHFSSTSDIIFGNATMILPERIENGHLVIRAGRIAEIGTGPVRGGYDLGGDFLAPGLVELHTDNLERHIRPRPGVDWPHASAILAHDAELAGCGITTVFDAMRVGSIPSRSDYAPYARGLASELMALRDTDALRISHFLHLRAEICSVSLLDELAEFSASDRIGLVSLMDHTPGQRQFRDVAPLRRYLTGKVGMTEEEMTRYFDELRELRRVHGPAHEQGVVDFARGVGAVLASHDDTTAEQVAISASHGARLAEFPTTIDAARACQEHGIATIMGAPNLIRGGSHSGNVAALDLANADLLDIISSDYVPSAMLPAMVMLAKIWDDWPRAMATMTATPAKMAGLEDRGQIKQGARADLIRFRMQGDIPVLRETWVQGARVA